MAHVYRCLPKLKVVILWSWSFRGCELISARNRTWVLFTTKPSISPALLGILEDEDLHYKTLNGNFLYFRVGSL